MRNKRIHISQMTLGILLMTLVFIGLGTNPIQAQGRERAELMSYAQDLYRSYGIDISRNAFDLVELARVGRVFRISIETTQDDLSQDLMTAFLVGGAVSQHAVEAMDRIQVTASYMQTVKKTIILHASGDCCEKLYNNRLSADIFSADCLVKE